MKPPILSLICLACILNTSATAMRAPSAGNATDATAPSYDMKAQAVLDLQAMNKKCVDLAEALPSDKLTWRLSPGPLLKCFCMLLESATESSA
jgi:hypothetical protein